MNVVGDLNKVWEVRALKRKPASDDAQKMLDRIAKQVQPIMRRHNWRVKLLSEFCPNNPRLLGLNVGGGVHVKLRLRRVNRDQDFIPYDQVLDTMLHELCHNAHGPHNASFYKLWDELRKECEELISKGISGSGDGFDMPGRRLGGFSRQPPISSLRQISLAAAQKRATLGSILPSGPNRVGGDSSIMASLSPIQAAAMAAERRLQDEIWCGSQSAAELDDEENDPNVAENVEFRDKSVGGPRPSNDRKRSRELLNSLSAASSDSNLESGVLHKCRSTSTSTVVGHGTSSKRDRKSRESTSSDPEVIHIDSVASSSSSTHRQYTLHNTDDSTVWECRMCTFFNPPLAPLCAICCTERRPLDNDAKNQTWPCKFCTLENSMKLDKCTACDQWRYSYGAPIVTRGPEVGT